MACRSQYCPLPAGCMEDLKPVSVQDAASPHGSTWRTHGSHQPSIAWSTRRFECSRIRRCVSQANIPPSLGPKLTTFFTPLVFPASRVDDPPKGCLSRHGLNVYPPHEWMTLLRDISQDRLNSYPLQEISSCAHLRGVSPSSGHSHHLSLDLFPHPGSPVTLKSDLCFISVQALAQT